MGMDDDVFTSTMPLTIDELRWLYLSSALDSLAAGRASPSSLRADRQRKLSQSLPNMTLGESGKLSGFDTTFHFRSASAPTSILKPSSPVCTANPSWHLNSSRSAPPHPTTSPCQEWIYRRPNKSVAFRREPSAGTVSPCRIRHYKSQDQILPYTEPEVVAANHSQDATPFWPTVLRPRPMLKERPSRAHLVISPPFMLPLPTISPSPTDTTFRFEKMDTSPLRTPSITSIASTASSTSAPNTPTATSFAYAPRRHPLRTRPPGHCRHTKALSDYSPPSSFSPSKSILTRSSSVSTNGSHTTSSTSVPSPTKSVKFVETPTVHYASRGYWDLESLKEVEASQGLPDAQVGVGVEEIDSDSDDFALPQMMEQSESAISHEATCVILDAGRGRTKGLQRIISLKRRASLPTKTEKMPLSRRPTISGPYVLGAFQVASAEDYCPSPPSLPDHLPLQRPKSSQSTCSLSLNRIYLRSAPSLESVRSTRSAAARTIRSTNGANNPRGVRAWLEKIRLG